MEPYVIYVQYILFTEEAFNYVNLFFFFNRHRLLVRDAAFHTFFLGLPTF